MNQGKTSCIDFTPEDFRDLKTALDHHDRMDMIRWYVDKEEETVVMYNTEPGVAEENDRLGELIEQDFSEERFVRIHARSSKEEWRDMARFIDEKVEDPVVRNRLREAIDGDGAFRRFKKAVQGEGLKAEWHQFKDQCIHEAAIKWLDARSLISEEQKQAFQESLEERQEKEDKPSREEQMTEGAVVECRWGEDHVGLSEGTQYEVLDERPGENLIQILDDRDNRKWYNKPLFNVIEQGRERDLDDLLLNIEVEQQEEHLAHARILFDQGGYWTVRVAKPEWIQKNLDPDQKGAHLGLRKIVIVPSLEEREVNRALTALWHERSVEPYVVDDS